MCSEPREEQVVARRRALALAGLFVVVSLIFVSPLFHRPGYLGVEDWDMNLFKSAAARITILDFHQFPLWNPWQNGGLPALAHPESRFLSPTFLFVLAFGPVVGIKLEIAAHYVLGLWGMYLLARDYGLKVPESITAAFIYMLSGMFSYAIASGMSMFMAAALVPWAILAYRRSQENLKYALGTGAAVAVMFFGGGTQFAPMIMLFLLVEGAFEVVLRRAPLRQSFARLALAGTSAGVYGAVKLVPALELMQRYPRPSRISDAYSGYSVASLLEGFLDRGPSLFGPIVQGEGFLRGGSRGVDENAMYIGFLGLALVALGVALHSRRLPPLSLSVLLLLWLGLGDRAPISVWRLLHHVFPFSMMRVAQRMRFVFMAGASVFAGLGLRVFQGALLRVRVHGPRLCRAAGWLVPAMLGIDLMANSSVFGEAFPFPPPAIEVRPTFRQMTGLPLYNRDGWLAADTPLSDHSSWSSMYPALLSNVGTIRGRDALTIGYVSSAKPDDAPDYRGEAYLREAQGEVRLTYFSPNRIQLDVEVASGGVLVINQNYDRGWRVENTSDGGEDSGHAFAYQSLLAARVRPGRQSVTFRYLPRCFLVGLTATLIGIAGALAWIAWDLRASRRRSTETRLQG